MSKNTARTRRARAIMAAHPGMRLTEATRIADAEHGRQAPATFTLRFPQWTEGRDVDSIADLLDHPSLTRSDALSKSWVFTPSPAWPRVYARASDYPRIDAPPVMILLKPGVAPREALNGDDHRLANWLGGLQDVIDRAHLDDEETAIREAISDALARGGDLADVTPSSAATRVEITLPLPSNIEAPAMPEGFTILFTGPGWKWSRADGTSGLSPYMAGDDDGGFPETPDEVRRYIDAGWAHATLVKEFSNRVVNAWRQHMVGLPAAEGITVRVATLSTARAQVELPPRRPGEVRTHELRSKLSTAQIEGREDPEGYLDFRTNHPEKYEVGDGIVFQSADGDTFLGEIGDITDWPHQPAIHVSVM